MVETRSLHDIDKRKERNGGRLMFRPLRDRILVTPIYPKPAVSDSGIEVVELDDPPVTMGRVAVLPDHIHCPACHRPMMPQVDVGQVVLFAPSAGEEVCMGSVDYLMLREQDIMAVIDAGKE